MQLESSLKSLREPPEPAPPPVREPPGEPEDTRFGSGSRFRSHTTGSDLIVQATVSLAEIGKEIMNLPERPLGLSEASITITGFGAWAIGGGGWAYSWGAQDDNESIVTVGHQLD